MNFLKKSSAADDIFICIIYVSRLVVDYHPSWLNIICCGRVLAMLDDNHLPADDIQLKQMILI
jgi:hypothetical protein